MKRHLIVCLATLVGLSSCIDEINLSMEESNQALVIDAWMGNVPEETYVKIYRTAPYVSGAINPGYAFVLTKRVAVEDRSGKSVDFSLVRGSYRPPVDFLLEAGREYRLLIELDGGEVFESSWETMPPKVEINSLTTLGFEKQVLLSSGNSQFIESRTFADVQAVITDPGVGGLGYLIETSGISELYTSSDRDNCACICYENEPNIFAGMNIASNANFEGRSFGVSLGEIPLSYIGRFFVSSRLRVVTQSSFEYLNKINQQQRNSGSIFDPAPSRVKGNIKKRGAENEVVLGGFFLFQESTYEEMLYRAKIRASVIELDHKLEPIPPVSVVCTEYYTNATPIAPDVFKQ